MLRSRVLSSIDTSRLSEAVSRPGIDPRIWISYAVLISEPVIVTDANEQDIIADIMLLPSGTVETARVGAAYAGDGFGLYAPLHIDDEVLVMAPSGDPDQGLVITQRLWSPAAVPPQEVQAHPQDWTLVLEPGINMRLAVKGAGNVYVTADSGKVVLGSESASTAVNLVGDSVAATTAFATWGNSIVTAFNGLGVTIPAMPTPIGTTQGGASKVVAS